MQAVDIMQTAEQIGRFNSFLHLLDVADMVETLMGGGPFTVSPRLMKHSTSCPPGALDRLLAEENTGSNWKR